MYRINIIWELRVSETDELITTYKERWLENFNLMEQSKKIHDKINKIVLKYCGYSFNSEENYNNWTDYITTIGEGEGEEANDYKTVEEFKRKADFSNHPLYFLKIISKEEYNFPADYYTIQDYRYGEMYIIASYKTFEEAEEYCKKNNIPVNYIVPETFGDNFVELCDF